MSPTVLSFNPVRPWPSISAPKSRFSAAPVRLDALACFGLGLALASALTVAHAGKKPHSYDYVGNLQVAVSIPPRPAPHLSCHGRRA